MREAELKFLRVLAKQYPNVAAASTEIVNLKSILNLPKGTEHFISDIHGEYEQFIHIMNNGSGAVSRKIDQEFASSISKQEKRTLSMLVYYPELKLRQIKDQITEAGEDLEDWYKVTILRLVRLCRNTSSKYTRSKVRKALPKDFAYTIEELMTGRPDLANQEAYYNAIIDSVVEIDRASELIIALCHLIRRFVIDHLHVIGDIYDRGPYPHLVMDDLMAHHSIDIQWGNHDALWMGAAAGSEASMANMLRICARYGNLSIVEDAYGINLIPLMRLAMDFYADDPCDCFKLKAEDESDKPFHDLHQKMHKAITIMQFKLEGQVIRANPEFEMEDRLLLDKIDYENHTVRIGDTDYPMKDMHFPTIDPKDPYKLCPEEEDCIKRLKNSFLSSQRLQEHIRFLYAKGGLYKVFNNNLLYHGCVPLNEDGGFRKVKIFGKEYSGKALYDVLESYARKGYYAVDPKERKKGQDILWYIWENKNSPVYGKERMATFERQFIEDKTTHEEPKNAYYKFNENEAVISSILTEFGLDPETAHIMNGHVPVKVKKGESPAKCGGKLLVIDGGFSKAYQPTTGIAGYTLIYNSYGLVLTAHPPFKSMEETVLSETDFESEVVWECRSPKRRRVSDTDNGKKLIEEIAELKRLLKAYRDGLIPESE